MLILTVTSFNGTPLSQPLAARFDEPGGGIGRSDQNQLVLPDAERTISRLHAKVVVEAGSYYLVSCGSNPTYLNGVPLSMDQREPLVSGDEIRIGGYCIGVTLCPAVEERTSAAEPLTYRRTRAAPAARQDGADSTGLRGAHSPPASRRLPDDFDPFADLTPAGAPAAPADLDALFGLSDGEKSGSDPLQRFPGPGAATESWVSLQAEKPRNGAPPNGTPAAEGPVDLNAPFTSSADDVSLGAAAPRVVTPGQWFVAHFAAYPSGNDAAVAEMLKKQSPDANAILGKKTCRWAPDTEVWVMLAGEGFEVSQPRQRFIWNSRTETLDFAVRASEECTSTSGVLEFDVFVADFLVAVVCLNVSLGKVADPGYQVASTRAARTAFASYASADRSLVAHLVGAIQRSAGIAVFLDCLDLQASESWKPRLAHEILQRDVFMLFWSRKASASAWVEWEWQTAVRDKGAQAMQLHPLEPDVPPPPALRHLHMGSVHALVADFYSDHWYRHPFRWLSRRVRR